MDIPMEVSAASMEGFNIFMELVEASVDTVKAVEDSMEYMEVLRESYGNFQLPIAVEPSVEVPSGIVCESIGGGVHGSFRGAVFTPTNVLDLAQISIRLHYLPRIPSGTKWKLTYTCAVTIIELLAASMEVVRNSTQLFIEVVEASMDILRTSTGASVEVVEASMEAYSMNIASVEVVEAYTDVFTTFTEAPRTFVEASTS